MIFSGPGKSISARLRQLESHLQEENPVLVSVIHSFRQLDKVGYATGVLAENESFATQISWWPLISILGTFSAGKSTFINHYLGYPLQNTGNQAVDDKFTVICYSPDKEVRLLPGLALDADPRFPFYQISEQLEKVAKGEGARVDAYLQLKTAPAPHLKGKILIDSPGFDADAQRSATLRITNHIMDLSDLVLIFFDARHPEPGAMNDTLAHLVRETIHRADSGKFLYILNQIDTAAREDNPEEVVGAWQRALAQEGLTAGRFYCIYNEAAAVPIEDPAVRKRFESKRDQDLGEIHGRMEQVSVERAYRIVGALEKRAREISDRIIPEIRTHLRDWRKRVLWFDAGAGAILLALFLVITIAAGDWQGLHFTAPWWQTLTGSTLALSLTGLVLVGGLGYLHYAARRIAAGFVRRRIERAHPDLPERERLLNAFRRNTRFWRSIFEEEPAGWGRRAQRRLQRVIDDADRYVQMLNDRFTDPSGHQRPATNEGAPGGGTAIIRPVATTGGSEPASGTSPESNPSPSTATRLHTPEVKQQ